MAAKFVTQHYLIAVSLTILVIFTTLLMAGSVIAQKAELEDFKKNPDKEASKIINGVVITSYVFFSITTIYLTAVFIMDLVAQYRESDYNGDAGIAANGNYATQSVPREVSVNVTAGDNVVQPPPGFG